MDKATHTVKRAEGCRIDADVYATGAGPSPVVVWIHGGALIMGHRDNLLPWQRDRYLAAGYHVVSVDYRLAPETKLPRIAEDLEDALRWVRREGPSLFGADPERVAVVGHSAGGYLTLMSGFRVQPRPRALAAFYGYGDITGDWYRRASPYYCRQPLVTEEEAWASVGSKPISGTHDDARRARFYLYCRQQGAWPKLVAGHNPHTESQAFLRLCPLRNVTADFPPTLLLHGDQDTDVPYEQSVLMAAALGDAGVTHELVTIRGGGHGFDVHEKAPGKEAIERVVAFLNRHVQ